MEHPLDGGRSKVQAGATEDLEPTDDVGDEVGELVDGVSNLDVGSGTLFIEAAHPGTDRGGRDEETPGSLRPRPATGGPQLEDGQALGR